MAQAGVHGLLALAINKWVPDKKWLFIGILLGSIAPDLDNLAVAVATISGKSTNGLHRTFTHSLITVGSVILLFYLIAKITKQTQWWNLGLGLGIGIFLHILLDLLIWFNGVEILWPFPSWINLWEGVNPPDWFNKLLMPLEFLFFALYFILLQNWAINSGTDSDYLPKLKIWIISQILLFVIFLGLVHTLNRFFMLPYGLFYLLSLGLAFGVTFRMNRTLELHS